MFASNLSGTPRNSMWLLSRFQWRSDYANMINGFLCLNGLTRDNILYAVELKLVQDLPFCAKNWSKFFF